jgi:hypothetical protein
VCLCRLADAGCDDTGLPDPDGTFGAQQFDFGDDIGSAKRCPGDGSDSLRCEAAIERSFDTRGASAAGRKLDLDRQWRNSRTLASHNPLAYKAGTTELRGLWRMPPADGYL